MLRTLIVSLCILISFGAFAQKQKRNSLVTIRGNIGIPKSVSSQMFRTAFNGVYEGNLSVNVRSFSNFFVGLGYQNSHFQNNKQVFAFYQFKDPNGNPTGASLSYNTQLDGQAGFLKVGYDQVLEKVYFSYSINMGLMFCQYQNVNLDTSLANQPYPPTNFNAPYVQPEVAVNFLTDGPLSFSIMMGYATLLYHFDPKAPRFNHIGEVNTKSNKYLMSWINIGFGFTIKIGK